jgi:hypothetical protein
LFLHRVPAPSTNIHPVPTSAASEEQAASHYETEGEGSTVPTRSIAGGPCSTLYCWGLEATGTQPHCFLGIRNSKRRRAGSWACLSPAWSRSFPV